MAIFRVRRWTGRESRNLGLIEAPDARTALQQILAADPGAGPESYWLNAPRGGFASVQAAIADAQGRPAEPFDPADNLLRSAPEIVAL